MVDKLTEMFVIAMACYNDDSLKFSRFDKYCLTNIIDMSHHDRLTLGRC